MDSPYNCTCSFIGLKFILIILHAVKSHCLDDIYGGNMLEYGKELKRKTHN
jgi:hypothetical protein